MPSSEHPAVASAICGAYEIVAQREGALRERADGALLLTAEDRYLIRIGEGGDRHALRGAMSVLDGGREGVLRFGNFIGRAELGGRQLVVESRRLNGAAVHDMLDEVAAALASLPFSAATPTAAPYIRARDLGADALYHAYVFLRDGIHGRGDHDVPAAVERILARPHESLLVVDPTLVPLGTASRVDAATLAAIHSEPELLSPLADDSPLGSLHLAKTLGGRMPSAIRVRPVERTTDNRENRFVVAVLEAMTDIGRRLERHARTSRRAASATNAREAAEIVATVARWRRHPILEPIPPARWVPLQSTVLRGRVGYRELLRFYGELIARTHMAEQHDLQTLLELRDAADLYELWCFFRVVDTVKAALSAAAEVSRFTVDALGTRVPYGYRALCGGAEVLYNASYSRPSSGSIARGQNSYSVRLRPDITVRAADGRLHLFDAKLKVDFRRAVDAEDSDDAGEPPDTFKREDLYKMHAYRDALGADSVWVLYPGSDGAASEYSTPWALGAGTFQGVGAIALRPGADHDGGLRTRIDAILGVTQS